MSAADEHPAASRRLNKEEENRVVARLYTESIESRQRGLEELDRRYYPVAEPTRISDERLKSSIERQVDQEMELRRTRRAEAEATMPVTNQRRGTAAAPRTQTHEEVRESVQRLYDDSLARKKENLEESRRRHAPARPPAAKVSKEHIQEWVDKSSRPKKTEYSVAEVNKIYGL